VEISEWLLNQTHLNNLFIYILLITADRHTAQKQSREEFPFIFASLLLNSRSIKIEKLWERERNKTTLAEFEIIYINKITCLRESIRVLAGDGCEENCGCCRRRGCSKNCSAMGSHKHNSLWWHNHSSPCLPLHKIKKQNQSSCSSPQWLQIGTFLSRHVQQLPQCKYLFFFCSVLFRFVI